MQTGTQPGSSQRSGAQTGKAPMQPDSSQRGGAQTGKAPMQPGSSQCGGAQTGKAPMQPRTPQSNKSLGSGPWPQTRRVHPPAAGKASGMAQKRAPQEEATTWAPTVERWAAEPPDADEGATPTPAEAALVQAAAACLEAGKSAPCAHCGNVFAEQWGDKPWHCFGCKKPLDTVRAAPEEAAKAAVVAVDTPFVIARGGGLTTAGEKRHAARGVCVRFLLRLLASLPPAVRRTVTTGDMVAHLIKPATRRSRCRFVELPAMRAHVGQPRAFVSHVWSALFADLVAAIAHAIPEDDYVWVDILCAAALSPNLGPVAARRQPRAC